MYKFHTQDFHLGMNTTLSKSQDLVTKDWTQSGPVRCKLRSEVWGSVCMGGITSILIVTRTAVHRKRWYQAAIAKPETSKNLTVKRTFCQNITTDTHALMSNGSQDRFHTVSKKRKS